jgi:hypothetical protein
MPDHAHRRARVAQPASVELLDEIDYRFRLCGEGPRPLSVDGRALGHGLPRRLVPLVELSAVLMHPSCSLTARDVVWRLLVSNARTGDDSWVVGAVGVALPGLRYRAYLLSRGFTGDVQPVLVAEFVKVLRTIDLGQPGLVGALLSAAFSKARAVLRAEQPAACGQASFAPGSVRPAAGFGHPDFVLARAVRAGVITAGDADMIAVTRLEDVPVAQYAGRVGVSRWMVYKRRRAAEARLAAAISSGALADPYAEVVAEATATTAPEPHTHHWP